MSPGTNDNKPPSSSSSKPSDDSGVSVSGGQSSSSNSTTSGSETDGGVTDVSGENLKRMKENAAAKKAFEDVQLRAEKLAEFIVSQTLGSKTKPSDNVEETMLRCVKSMTTKHKILFNGMMNRLKINEETAYSAFITVANELFEGEKSVVNWGRVIALYAFGGQLALYCEEKQLKECGSRIPKYVGRYAKDVISSFVYKEGGWKKICEEFPPDDDLDNKVWKLLTWTAVGLGLATAASFLTSH